MKTNSALIEFNLAFLRALRHVAPEVKTGKAWYNPTVRLQCLRDCRDDIELFGLLPVMKKWQHFIGKTPVELITADYTPAPAAGDQLELVLTR